MDILTKNADRFLGFADTYEQVRPEMPLYPIQLIKNYIGNHRPAVVDLGCGTGLSTLIWKDHCSHIVGIEPSADMLALAQQKATDQITFKQAFAHETGLEDNCADAVVCSQSFHWMEPVQTLKEIDRILKPRGIFATVDCDWPPVCNWKAEKAYQGLFNRINLIEKSYKNIGSNFHKWDKNKHLENIASSHYFSYSREIVFAHTEDCNADRFINIALSQGGLQNILKLQPELIRAPIEAFQAAIKTIFAKQNFPIDFCYRVRLGIR